MRLLAEHRWTLFNRVNYMEDLTVPNIMPLLPKKTDVCCAVYTENIHAVMGFQSDGQLLAGEWLIRTSTGCNLRGALFQ